MDGHTGPMGDSKTGEDSRRQKAVLEAAILVNILGTGAACGASEEGQREKRACKEGQTREMSYGYSALHSIPRIGHMARSCFDFGLGAEGGSMAGGERAFGRRSLQPPVDRKVESGRSEPPSCA